MCPKGIGVTFFPIIPADERRLYCWCDEVHVRNHSSGNERYFAKRGDDGDEHGASFIVGVGVLIGVTVANDGDGSSVAKR